TRPQTPVGSILSDLVIVTAPKPPGSRTLISPPAAVFEMAPAKVLHGAVREHGLASSPTPDTHVRVACAWAGAACRQVTRARPKTVSDSALLRMIDSRLIVPFTYALKCSKSEGEFASGM